MNRKQFIESQGATCKNWTWSWSFINEAAKIIIFGAWDANTTGNVALILSPDWQTNQKGRRLPGYEQSREHIRLIEEKGYTLKTFPMKYAKADDSDDLSAAKIDAFTPTLTDKTLLNVGGHWYASDDAPGEQLPDELRDDRVLLEGAVSSVQMNAFERNPAARAKCLAHYGYNCIVCDVSLEAIYGEIGRRFIHVHHIVPLSDIRKEYIIDPIKDLVPVCPNCHAIIHRAQPALSVGQLKQHLSSRKD